MNCDWCGFSFWGEGGVNILIHRHKFITQKVLTQRNCDGSDYTTALTVMSCQMCLSLKHWVMSCFICGRLCFWGFFFSFYAKLRALALNQGLVYDGVCRNDDFNQLILCFPESLAFPSRSTDFWIPNLMKRTLFFWTRIRCRMSRVPASRLRRTLRDTRLRTLIDVSCSR